MNEFATRTLVVVNPMVKVPVVAPEVATPIFWASVAVVAAKEVTVTVLPIFGRTPVVVDAASRVTPLLLVETEKVPAG